MNQTDNSLSDLFHEIIGCYYDYLKNEEHKETNGIRQHADMMVKIKARTAQKDAATIYFQHNLAESEKLYNIALKTLDIAVKNGNEEMAAIAMRTICMLHKKVPFLDE